MRNQAERAGLLQLYAAARIGKLHLLAGLLMRLGSLKQPET